MAKFYYQPPTAAQLMLAADLGVINQVTPETSKMDLSRILNEEIASKSFEKLSAKKDLRRKINHRLFNEKINSGLMEGCEIEFSVIATKPETKWGIVISINLEKKHLMIRTEKGTKAVFLPRIISFNPRPMDKNYGLVVGCLGAWIKKGLRGERFKSYLKEVKAKNSNITSYYLPNSVLSEALEAEQNRKEKGLQSLV